MIAKCWERAQWRLPVNEYRVPFGGDENIPKVNSVDGYSSLNILKTTE